MMLKFGIWYYLGHSAQPTSVNVVRPCVLQNPGGLVLYKSPSYFLQIFLMLIGLTIVCFVM